MLHALRQRVRKQVRGIQGLRQVVTDCGEPARLRVVGAFRLCPCGLELGSTRTHTKLECLVGAFQLGFGVAEGGDIGERRHKTTAGHRIAANLDGHAIAKQALGDIRRTPVT